MFCTSQYQICTVQSLINFNQIKHLKIGFETTSNITIIHLTLNDVKVYLIDGKNNIYYHISAHFTNNILLGVFRIE